jgi:hypothetical protein
MSLVRSPKARINIGTASVATSNGEMLYLEASILKANVGH